MTNPYAYHTPRLTLEVLDEKSARPVLDYYSRNRAFHQPWFSARDAHCFTLDHQKRQLQEDFQAFLAGRAIPFYLFDNQNPRRVIGRVSLSNIVHGAFRSCFLGYHLDEQSQGQGLAAEAIEAAVRIAFDDFHLHRVEANIMPRNHRSIRLVQRLGFTLEGLSHRYLEINGVWEDHLHFVKLNEPAGSEHAMLPEWTTDRLSIRLLVIDDLPAILSYHDRNQGFINRHNPLADSASSLEADWQDRLSRNQAHMQLGQPFDVGLFLSDRKNTLVGLVSFGAIEPLPYSTCEIGYSVDQSMTGRGIAFEALMTLLPFAFRSFGLNRIHARVRVDNEASLKLLGQLGFTVEGRAREGVFMDGTWHDFLTLSVLRKVFDAL